MGRGPLQQALTLQRLRELLKPQLVFYRPAVDDILKRGDLHEIQELLKGARAAKKQYGDLDKMIAKLEGAAKKAKG